jgi:PAS domain-containing protein
MTENSPTEQTNALLAAVVASSMDAVFSIDTNARIATWNSAAGQLYGYTAAEAIGQALGLLAPDPRTMRQGVGSNAYFKASRFISKRLVDAKMEIWSRLGSALRQFGT